MEGKREEGRHDDHPPAGAGVLSDANASEHGELLLLLRVAFCDGPLNERARRALAHAAMRLGIAETELPAIVQSLEGVESCAIRLIASQDMAVRTRLLQQALGIVALDPETTARSERLRMRLMLLLDLLPGDAPAPRAA